MVSRARRVRLPVDKPQQKPDSERWKGTILDLKGIGHGISGMVFIINESKVVKASFGSEKSTEDLEAERKAYRILRTARKPSPHILRCFDADDPRGLILERCQETVRHRLKSIPKDTILCDLEVRKWAKQAAEGIAFIHHHEIIQGDVGCHNMLLDSMNVLKLCDFAGSSVAGSPASIAYELRSRLPSVDEPTEKSDLFALGSAIYEMSTGEPPYREKSSTEVLRLYEECQFPSVKDIASLGTVITKCWLQKWTSASEIAHDIDPQQSLCCGPREELSNVVAQSPKTGLGLSTSSRPPSSNLPISSSKSTKLSTENSVSSWNTSFLSATSASSTRSSHVSLSERAPTVSPFKDITILDYVQQDSGNQNSKEQRHFETTSSRDNAKPTSRKKRHQGPVAKWMNKSLQVRRRDSF